MSIADGTAVSHRETHAECYDRSDGMREEISKNASDNKGFSLPVKC